MENRFKVVVKTSEARAIPSGKYVQEYFLEGGGEIRKKAFFHDNTSTLVQPGEYRVDYEQAAYIDFKGNGAWSIKPEFLIPLY